MKLSTPHFQVGFSYPVPCVKTKDTGSEWIPILPPLHEDQMIFGADYHYHIDFRFLPEPRFKLWTEQFPEPGFALSRILFPKHIIAGPCKQRMEYLREMPEFRCLDFEGRPFPQFIKLENKYRNSTLDLKTLRCPHRKISLQGMPIRDGKITCPGHGLCFQLRTGQLVPRSGLPNPPEAMLTPGRSGWPLSAGITNSDQTTTAP